MNKILWLVIIVTVLLPLRRASAFEQADLDKLLTTNACAKCDLSGAELADKDLSKANLEGANLAGADLSRTSLRMADMAGTDLRESNLSLTILEAADLYQANFSGAKLEGTIFDGAYLLGAVFKDGQLPVKTKVAEKTEVKPVEAGAGGEIPGQEKALVVEEEIAGTSVHTTETIKVLATTADPVLAKKKRRPVPDQNQQAPLSQKELLDKALDTGRCVECDFSKMDLAGVNFKKALLERTNFEGSNLNGANFKGANLKAANFRNANLQEANLKGADLYKANFEGTNLKSANLKGAALDGAYVRGADFDGANLDKVRK